MFFSATSISSGVTGPTGGSSACTRKTQVICRGVQGHERSSEEFGHTYHRRGSSYLDVVAAVGLPSMTSTSSAAAWLPPCTPNGCRSPNSPLSSPPGSHTVPLPLQAPMVAVPQTLPVLLPVREAVRESNSTRSVKEKKRDGHPPPLLSRIA